MSMHERNALKALQALVLAGVHVDAVLEDGLIVGGTPVFLSAGPSDEPRHAPWVSLATHGNDVRVPLDRVVRFEIRVAP